MVEARMFCALRGRSQPTWLQNKTVQDVLKSGMPPAAKHCMLCRCLSQRSTMGRRRTQWAPCRARWPGCRPTGRCVSCVRLPRASPSSCQSPFRHATCPHSKSSCRLALCMRNRPAVPEVAYSRPGIFCKLQCITRTSADMHQSKPDKGISSIIATGLCLGGSRPLECFATS